MTTNPKGYIKEYVRRKRNRLLHYFGRVCAKCRGKNSLEFAHKEDTGLNGAGRGGLSRVRDVEKNRDKYLLLCKKCHYEYDNPEALPYNEGE